MMTHSRRRELLLLLLPRATRITYPQARAPHAERTLQVIPHRIAMCVGRPRFDRPSPTSTSPARARESCSADARVHHSLQKVEQRAAAPRAERDRSIDRAGVQCVRARG
ncbi:hypothetical protein BC827DRAFT_122689 [Russula dissimulans]|nr:hypothetical protein BC827DRAFT_122689 [Russula dissimulans]